MIGVNSAVKSSKGNNIEVEGGGIDKGMNGDGHGVVDEEVAVPGDSLKFGEYAMS